MVREAGRSHFVRGVLVVVPALLALAVDASAWCSIGASCNKNWSYRRKLTFNNTTAENLSGFQVLVKLNSGRVDYTKTRNDGFDLRFVDSDDATLLDHEIESWNESGDSYVWVRVPQVNASSNTDFIWMYYGNPSAPNVQNAAAVWAGYSMVQHLQETSGTHFDSTSNGNNSSAIDVQAQGSPTGLINGADVFSAASTDNVDVPDSASLDMAATDSFVVEAWINASSAAFRMVVSKENFGVGNDGEIQLAHDGAGNAAFWVRSGFGGAAQAGSATNVTNGAWRYLVGRWNEATSTAEIFVDGLSVGSASSAMGAVETTGTPLVIGEEGDADRGFNFDGRIDEVRVWKSAGAVRSGNWIRAQYDSMRDSGAGLVGSFVSYGAEAAHCCALSVTETASTITVTGANRFELRFNGAFGGAIDQFFDLEEDPARGFDLAGGNNSQDGLFIDEFGWAVDSINYRTDKSTAPARLDLLEATNVRARVRSESFYGKNGSAVVPPAVKGIGDYTVQFAGRMGIRFRRVTTSPLDITWQQLQVTERWDDVNPPYSSITAYSQSGLQLPPYTVASNQAGTDDFVMLQNEMPGARTDFLMMLSQDWPAAVNTRAQGVPASAWIENSWITAVAPLTLPVGTQTWNLLMYFKPTTLGAGASPWLDPAVTSRSSDYRTPSTTVVSAGAGWVDAAENTNADPANVFFNEAESAYVFDLSQATGLSFAMDGSGTTRHYPFFKIRQWRSFIESPQVTFDPDGPGGNLPRQLSKNIDYRAAVKPVSRAEFATSILYHTTLQDSAAITTPDIGNATGGGPVGVAFPAGRYGAGAEFDSTADQIDIPLVVSGRQNIELDRGRIEFWYKPNSNHDDNAEHYLFDLYNNGLCRIRIKKEDGTFSNNLTVQVVDATNTLRNATISSASYSWRAGDWVHLAMSWDSSLAVEPVKAYMNGAKLTPVAASTGPFTMEAESATGTLRIGNRVFPPSGGFTNANGIIDEFTVYGAAAPTELAHGGLTTDGREFLADSVDNSPLPFAGVDAEQRGAHFTIGTDAKFHGLNVTLAVPGSWSVAGDLAWEYWNGTAWADLEAAVAVTDGTNQLTLPKGTIHWSADPAGWSPYSINGGPDLYYVRVHLAAGGSYATPPTEQVIKTDILLFQYCQDVTSAGATFAFSVPPTTEVKLESFAAQPGDGSVLLEWRTASELSNLGFHLYRSLSADGPWTRLTSSLIPGLGSSPVGQAYSYRDGGLVNGTRYFYRLEDVDAASKTTSHGPVSAVPLAGVAGDDGSGGAGAPGGTKKKAETAAGCPAWVLAAYGSSEGSAAARSLRCTRHGNPEAVSLRELSRDSRQATVELRTGGFYALHEPAGTVRVFVPGFDFAQDEGSAALPHRRALVEAVVGRRVELAGVRATDLVGFRGLVPSALGKAEMEVVQDGTVRAGRRAAARRALVRRGAARPGPDELVKLLPSQFQGEKKSAVLEISPVRYDERRAQLVLAQTVRLRLEFVGREVGESGRGGLGRAPRTRKSEATGEVLARLYTTSLGLYAVTFEELFPGQSRGVSVSTLRLEKQGEAVGFHVEPNTSSFGPGSRLYFYAAETAASTDYSGELAYELVSSREGLAMALGSAAAGSSALASPSTVRRVFETNRFYQPGLLEAEDVWLGDALASGATRVQSFTLAGVDATGPAALEVFLQGASESGSPVDHHVSASLNGVLVGEARFAGKKPYRISVRVAGSLLREGTNELQLTSVADTGVSSLVFLDRFAILHPQSPVLTGGRFSGTWRETGTASVAFASTPVAVVELGDGSGGFGEPDQVRPRWLTGYSIAGGTLRFTAEAGRHYLAVAAEGLLGPRVARPQPSELRSTGNQADYLLIAPQTFLPAASPLLARRQDQGLVAKAVAFEEIAESFGHGRPSAEAIREFLSYAYQSWQRPSPRYVLLLGDSSYDPRNFAGNSQPSPLPALWTRTSYLWTASDPLLAAVNGADSLPDLAIGRLPATTLEQAGMLVEKLLAWEGSGQGLGGRATLVADNPDIAGDFEADAEDIRASFLSGRESEVLKLSELGASTRPRVQEALNGGLSYLGYVGHGGAAVWASENVWNTWDAQSLQVQSQQPLLVTMNCLNGYFVAPTFESLAESLLKAEGRGAVASFSPSGLSIDGPAHQYHRALVGELVSGRHERLGDAVLAAQQTYAESGLMPELLGIYHLLGDPATKIR